MSSQALQTVILWAVPRFRRPEPAHPRAPLAPQGFAAPAPREAAPAMAPRPEQDFDKAS